MTQLFAGATPKLTFGLGHPSTAMVKNLTQLYLGDTLQRLVRFPLRVYPRYLLASCILNAVSPR
jgi:hypothetical protein